MWGGFFDTTYAFRFDDPSHDVIVARPTDAAGALIAEAFHFPLGRGYARHDLGLEATVELDGPDWVLSLRTRRLAQSVRLMVDGYWPDDNYFYLAPGELRRIILRVRGGIVAHPSGYADALNELASTTF